MATRSPRVKPDELRERIVLRVERLSVGAFRNCRQIASGTVCATAARAGRAKRSRIASASQATLGSRPRYNGESLAKHRGCVKKLTRITRTYGTTKAAQ